MIMAFAPANCYQPPKSVLQTMVRTDQKFHLGAYEFFREQSWQMSHVLQGYVNDVKFE